MLAGLSLHSFLEGFTIGHEQKDDDEDRCRFHLFAFFVLFTKTLLTFFVGLQGFRINDKVYPTSNPTSETPSKKFIMLVFIICFIGMSPLGEELKIFGHFKCKIVCHSTLMSSILIDFQSISSLKGIVTGIMVGPFEDCSFLNQNVLLGLEACGTGTFAFVVFVKILPKQAGFT